MSGVRVDVEISAGVFETIKTYSKIMYDVPLNATRYFDVLVEGSGTDYRSSFAIGRKIFFYFNEVLEMKGEILKRSHATTGELRLEGIGFMERRMGQANCATQAFSSTNTIGVVNSDTNNLLSKVTSISAGTIENQTVNNFRTSPHQSTLEGVSRLTELTGQDWSSDDANDELDIEDHKGSSSTIGTLTDGINVKNVFEEENDTKKLSKITVLGKGFGSNQVSGSAVDGWSQGDAEKTIVDRSIDSDTEAADLATKLLDIEKLTRFRYSFEVISPFFSFALGDVITLDAPRIGVDDTNLRIVRFKRVVTRNSNKLLFETRATGERESAEDSIKTLLLTKRANREAAMTQPSDDGTGSISDSGHLHADGTYGTDSHPHADGSLAADSTTSSNNPSLARDNSSRSSETLTLDDDGTTWTGLGPIDVSGMNDGDTAVVHVFLDMITDTSGNTIKPLTVNCQIIYNSVTYVYPFTILYNANTAQYNTIANWIFFIPLEPTSDGTLAPQVRGDSSQDANFSANAFARLWSVARHVHSISSFGVSGNTSNTAPGVSGNSASENASVSDAGHSH